MYNDDDDNDMSRIPSVSSWLMEDEEAKQVWERMRSIKSGTYMYIYYIIVYI